MLLYAITNRCLLANIESEQTRKLAELAALWGANSVDFIQIREKDLASPELLILASEIAHAVRQTGAPTKVMLNIDTRSNLHRSNAKTAVALVRQVGADGLHLPGRFNKDLLATFIQETREGLGDYTPISVSCHTSADIVAARNAEATLALFAPVFEKVLPGIGAARGTGIDALKAACHVATAPSEKPPLPILALGGVTLENAAQCISAGAAGIAAIRLFIERPDLKIAIQALPVAKQ